MRDENFDRDYQSGRTDLHNGLDRLFSRIADAFDVLHHGQWEAPWLSDRSGAI